MTDGLRAALEGSLPDELVHVEPIADAFADWRKVEDIRERAKPTRHRPSKRTRCRFDEWTKAEVAAAIGIHPQTLSNHIRRDPTLAAMLKVPSGNWPREHGISLSEEEVRAAGLRYVEIATAWGGRTRRASCVRCGSSKSRHLGNGVCAACYQHGHRQARGLRIRPHREAWDTVRGLTCCSICHRSDTPHKESGRCNACATWWHRRGLARMSKKDQTRMAAGRRRIVKGGRAKKGVAVPLKDKRRKAA